MLDSKRDVVKDVKLLQKFSVYLFICNFFIWKKTNLEKKRKHFVIISKMTSFFAIFSNNRNDQSDGVILQFEFENDKEDTTCMWKLKFVEFLNTRKSACFAKIAKNIVYDDVILNLMTHHQRFCKLNKKGGGYLCSKFQLRKLF